MVLGLALLLWFGIGVFAWAWLNYMLFTLTGSDRYVGKWTFHLLASIVLGPFSVLAIFCVLSDSEIEPRFGFRFR